jgi:hypothetical protein
MIGFSDIKQKEPWSRIEMNKMFCLNTLTLLIVILFSIVKTATAADPYAVISEKNLFRPDREEWVIEKTDSKMLDKKIDTSKLELFGTVIIGDKKSALIYDKQVKKKGKGKSKGKSKAKNRRRKKKAEIFSLGDYIGGYVVSAIDEKKVVLDYYGEKATLYLHEGKEPTDGDVTPLTEEKPKPKKTKPKPKKGKPKGPMHDKLTAGKIPEALAKSPFMSEDNMKKVLEFNKEIMEELKESGGTLDPEAIKEKVGKFRERFMEEMGSMLE